MSICLGSGWVRTRVRVRVRVSVIRVRVSVGHAMVDMFICSSPQKNGGGGGVGTFKL